MINYADDVAIVGTIPNEMMKVLTKFKNKIKIIGLSINIEKTEFMSFGNKNDTKVNFYLGRKCEENKIKQVEKFK
jgi:hypothetical protein